jgi:hypothetical protein
MPALDVTLPPDLPRSTALATPPAAAALFDAGHLWRHGVQVALANVAIAGLVSTINDGHFGRTLVYAQCIGLSIWLVIECGRWLMPNRTQGWPAGWHSIALVVGACMLGYVAGTTISDAIFGYSSWLGYLRQPRALLRDFGPTATFCAFVSGWFWMRGQARANRAQAAAAAHDATLARLSLLQSQLEPHMLFNTLANLRALIAADPQRAQDMLDHLIAFLRATLNASRCAWATGCAPAPRCRRNSAPSQCPRCCCSRWWRTRSSTASNPSADPASCTSPLRSMARRSSSA